MRIQTIKYESLYAGKQEVNLCESCSNHLEGTLRTNSQHTYHAHNFKALSNWHDGTCEQHEYHQTCLDKYFKLMEG